MKENLQPCADKRSEPARVMACLLKNEPASSFLWEAKVFWTGAPAKASLKRAKSVRILRDAGSDLEGRDPKPRELPMARVKRPETGVEARTVPCCKTVRGAVGRGEMPNERGDSWFSPKCIEVQRSGARCGG